MMQKNLCEMSYGHQRLVTGSTVQRMISPQAIVLAGVNIYIMLINPSIATQLYIFMVERALRKQDVQQSRPSASDGETKRFFGEEVALRAGRGVVGHYVRNLRDEQQEAWARDCESDHLWVEEVRARVRVEEELGAWSGV